nr:gustatory receptor 5a for trehalose-like [Danaus plexippus plexippus]
MTGQILMTIMCIYNTVYSKASLNIETPVIFYGMTCITMAMFLRVATLWPKLVRHITAVEESDPNYDTSLNRKCNVTCVIILLLSSFEYVLSLLFAFVKASELKNKDSWCESFAEYLYPWVFNYLPFSPLLGVMVQLIHFQATFIVIFSDLFIICMSYYLTSRLRHINTKVLVARQKHLPEIFWGRTREDYTRAVKLVRKVDDVISGIIFISFAHNLFFVCVQLFHTLERSSALGGYKTETYFVFSLIYLIIRSVAVSLITSQINTASMSPALVLYDVPTSLYCIEVQRFLDQVTGDKIALTGLQFFRVTRKLLLNIAGTIVTYELVMFQFDTTTSNELGTPFPSTNLMNNRSFQRSNLTG